MRVLGREITLFKLGPKKEIKTDVEAQFTGYGNGNGVYRTLWGWSFNGEKNFGEAGPIKNYRIDYEALRTRSWQAFLENELAQTIMKKYTKWVIGKGLKLQAEPEVNVLEAEGITIDREEWSRTIESRFTLYARSRNSDYANMTNLQSLQAVAHKNAIIGGDVLVILRVDKETNTPTVQLIDGSHVMNPLNIGKDVIFWENAKVGGTRIENGIELDSQNRHLAYFVRKPGPYGYSVETQKVMARGESGLIMAYLVYGLKYRIDNMRGLPLVAAVIETLKKLDRYKEATVGSAEELAKVSFQVVHQQYGTGESPLTTQLARAHDAEAVADLPVDVAGRELANTVAATTNKQAFNNPIGAEIKTINPNKYQLYFKDFYTANSESICSTVGMPPDVAFSKYNSNYSASRAAIKDWENTLNIDREDFAMQFMRPIYELWTAVQVLTGKIQAPGFLEAILKNDYMVITAYTTARWVGAPVPHIDPVKEVQAERMKLGATAVNLPLTTLEAATEALNGGESDANMDQYAKELEESKELGIEPEPEPVAPGGAKPNKPAKKSD